MRNLLYVLAVIIVIAWAIGFIGYSVGGIIHVLLVIALITILLGIIQSKNKKWDEKQSTNPPTDRSLKR